MKVPAWWPSLGQVEELAAEMRRAGVVRFRHGDLELELTTSPPAPVESSIAAAIGVSEEDFPRAHSNDLDDMFAHTALVPAHLHKRTTQ